jgi:CubicO group peptidase (beta-lactamase class C family)
MLSHESGLAGEPPDTDWSAPAYEGDIGRNLARVAEIGTRVPPNAQQKYSNLAFQLLGEIVARTSGTTYVDHVRREILEPLGMTRSGFEPLPERLAASAATGYAGRLFSDELDVAAIPPTVWAEGGLWSCVEDLARWVAFQFREEGGRRGGAQVLDGATLREMHRPRYLGDEAWTEAWCLAWYAQRKDDVVWVQHSGNLHGFSTNVCFDPKNKVGAIALVNGLVDAEELAMRLGAIAREAVRDAASPIEPPAPMPESHAPLLGVYVNRDEGELITVEWRDGALTVVSASEPTWRPVLGPTEDPDAFVVEPGVRQSGEPAIFRRAPDGRVASLYLAAETWLRLDPVT